MALSKSTISSHRFSKVNEEEDRRLWQSLTKGNELAFSSLFKKYVNPLFNYGMHLYPDREEIKEIIQELFTRLWLSRESLKEVEQVNFYVFTCFRNALFQRLKKIGKVSFSDEYENLEIKEQSAESQWIEEEKMNALQFNLHNAIDKLSPRQKEVVLFRFYQGLDHDQIAQVMGISKEGVYNLLSKAISMLKSRLKDSRKFF